MSTFPNANPTDIDSLIKANRAATPKAVTDLRKTPRYSIEEINNTDLDTLKDKFLSSRIDDRSPIVRVLDMVDLPRNVVANAIFRPAGLETKKLRKGAFGLPSISFSDALGELGVKPGLIRGIAGFVGDVALDPLTYVGPPGWGLKVASTAGREVAIGARGAREIKRSIDALRKGKSFASSAETKALFDELSRNAGRTFASGAEQADYLSKKLLGDISVPKTTVGKAADQFGRILGGEKKYEGGLLADSLEKERFFDAGAQQARDFTKKFGKASAPGNSIGGRGSQVAHIPFTELSVSTAPMTRGGRAALEDYNIAASAAARPIADILPGHAKIAGLANDIHNSIDETSQHFSDTEFISNMLPPDQVGPYQAARTLDMQKMLEVNRARMNDLTAAIEGSINGVDPAKPESIADLMALHKVKEEAVAKFRVLETRAKALPEYSKPLDLSKISDDEALVAADTIQDSMKAWQKYHNSVDGAVGNFMAMNPQETALVDAAAKFLGTDERMTGRTAMAGMEAALKRVGGPSVALDLTGGINRRVENMFGVKGSQLADAIRAYQHSMSASRVRAINDLENGVFREIDEAFRANGIKPDADDIDQALAMLTGFHHQIANERAGRDVFYTTRADDPSKPDIWLQHLQDAIASGKFGKASGDLTDRLKAIAAKYGNDLGDALWEVEDAFKLAPEYRTGYLANALTEEARAAVERGARYNPEKPATSRLKQGQSEFFQKERTFDQVRWTDATGAPKRLFRVDESLAKRLIADPDEITALRLEGHDDIANELETLVKDYQDYLQSSEAGNWHPTSPFEMNQLYKNGRFSILTDGADLPGGFMHQNLLSSMASRVGSHHIAIAREQFSKIRQQWAKPIDGVKFKNVLEKGGNKFVAQDGTVGEIVGVTRPDGKPDKGFKVGNQVYRRISQELRADPSNPMITMMGKESSEAVYPKEVADSIERIAEVFKTPESVNSLLKGYDTIIRYWKSTTLLHPSWSIFNMVGDTLLGIQNGLPLKHFFSPENAKFAGRAIRNLDNPAELEKLKIVVNGQEVSAADLVKQAMDEMVMDGTMMQEAAGQLAANGYMRFASTRPAGRRGLAGMRPSAVKSDYVETLKGYTLGRQAESIDKIKAGGAVLSDRVAGNIFAPWFRVNQKAANYIRFNMFVSYLKDGFDVKSAARKVIDSQFDYSNATVIEREVFRRMFPFYSWMRNNGAYQIKKLFESPVYAASYPKVHAAIEEGIAGEERVPIQHRPNWMRQQLAMQIGSDPDHRFALMFGGALPAGDVFQYLTPMLGPEGVQDFLRYFVSGANPVLGAAFDLGTGRERFSGRSIGPEGDITPGQYLLNQVRPIAEIPKIGKAFDKGAAQGLGRMVLGGRVQDFGAERVSSTKLRELKDRETMIRRRISKAERDGDKGTSLEMRARLLQLYDKFEEAGVGSEIPKWARRQLDQFANQP